MKNFSKRLIKIIYGDLGGSNLSVENLAQRAGMSKATLTRKLHVLVNMTPVEFIQHMRLKHALTLLSKGFGNVTEVAYEVGFNSVSYFSKCFYNHFGIKPSNEFTKMVN